MFEGVCAVLLSRDGKVDRMFDQCVHALTLGGGKWEKHVSDQSTHIVASDWGTVVSYFGERDFLLAYHYDHNHIVTWNWIYACMKASSLVDVVPFKLQPVEPISICPTFTKEECALCRGFMLDYKVAEDQLIELQQKHATRRMSINNKHEHLREMSKKEWENWRNTISPPESP